MTQITLEPSNDHEFVFLIKMDKTVRISKEFLRDIGVTFSHLPKEELLDEVCQILSIEFSHVDSSVIRAQLIPILEQYVEGMCNDPLVKTFGELLKRMTER